MIQYRRVKNKTINKNKKRSQHPKVYIHSAAVNWHAIGNVETSTVSDLNASSLVQVEEYIIPSSGCLKWSFPHFDFSPPLVSRLFQGALCSLEMCRRGKLGGRFGVYWSGESGRKRRRGRLGMTTGRGGSSTATDPGSVQPRRRAVGIISGASLLNWSPIRQQVDPVFLFFCTGGTNWREEFSSQRGQF